MVTRGKEVPNMNMLMSNSAMEIAARRVALMSRAVVDELIADLERRLERMRTCSSSVYDVDELRFAMHVSGCVEALGVVRGLSADIASAERVLESVEARFRAHTTGGERGSPALFGSEITALHDAIGLHRFQLSKLSAGEFGEAFRKAASRHRPQLLKQVTVPSGRRDRLSPEAFVAVFRRHPARSVTHLLKRVSVQATSGDATMV